MGNAVIDLPVQPIDFHTHLGEVRSFHPKIKGWIKVELNDLLQYMNEARVSKVVVHSLPPRSDPFSRIVSNTRLLRITGKVRDKVVPFCCPSPKGKNIQATLRRFLEEGCKGLGELKTRSRVDDIRILALLKTAEDLGIPALIHVEEGPIFKYCYGVESLAEVLEKLPSLKLIVHGPGWWKHISDDPGVEAYPSGPVRGEGLVQRLLRSFDDLYVDISATSGLNALSRDLEHARRFLEEFQDKVLYGTDFPCLSSSGQFGIDRSHINLLLNLGLGTRVLRKILRENAERVLR